MFIQDIYLNGKFEKSILLSNQQEIHKERSSETNTQSFFDKIENSNISILNTFNNAKPDHIKKYDINFSY